MPFARGELTAGQVREATADLEEQVAEQRRALTPIEPHATRHYLTRATEWYDFLDGRAAELPADEAEELNAFLRWAIEA